MPDCTTKVCTKCSTDKPLSEFGIHRGNKDGLQRWCKVCRHAHTRNPEWLAQKQAYDLERRERLGEYLLQQRRDYSARPDIKAHRKQYDESRRHDPHRLELGRARHYRRWADPIFRANKVAQLRKRRNEDMGYRNMTRLYQRVRKQRIAVQGVPFTHAEWVALCERYNHCCLACGERTTLTVDHVIPLAHGGSSGIENIQPLCLSCNRKKNARTIDYRW